MIATFDAFRVYGRKWGNLSEFDKIGLLWLDVPIFTGISEYTRCCNRAALCLNVYGSCLFGPALLCAQNIRVEPQLLGGRRCLVGTLFGVHWHVDLTRPLQK